MLQSLEQPDGCGRVAADVELAKPDKARHLNDMSLSSVSSPVRIDALRAEPLV